MLNDDERQLLRLIADSKEPVAASTFFPQINPGKDGMDPESAQYEAWAARQITLFGASVRLWELNLIRVVEPANGERPDLMEVTSQGVAALG